MKKYFQLTRRADAQKLLFGNQVIKKCVLPRCNTRSYNDIANEKERLTLKKMEEIIMALSNLFGWSKKMEETPASACGSACGAADKPEEKPAACGSACGAADEPEEKPSACRSACGAADK